MTVIAVTSVASDPRPPFPLLCSSSRSADTLGTGWVSCLAASFVAVLQLLLITDCDPATLADAGPVVLISSFAVDHKLLLLLLLPVMSGRSVNRLSLFAALLLRLTCVTTGAAGASAAPVVLLMLFYLTTRVTMITQILLGSASFIATGRDGGSASHDSSSCCNGSRCSCHRVLRCWHSGQRIPFHGGSSRCCIRGSSCLQVLGRMCRTHIPLSLRLPSSPAAATAFPLSPSTAGVPLVSLPP